MIYRATDDDLNCIRSIWFEEQLIAPPVVHLFSGLGRELGARLVSKAIDAALEAHGAYVVRPDGAPDDTVAAFMVADLSSPLVHWLAVKRAWRRQGLTKPLFAVLDGLEGVRFTRYATRAQREALEARGWTYAPTEAPDVQLVAGAL